MNAVIKQQVDIAVRSKSFPLLPVLTHKGINLATLNSSLLDSKIIFSE